MTAIAVGNFALQLSDISDDESMESLKRFGEPVSDVFI